MYKEDLGKFNKTVNINEIKNRLKLFFIRVRHWEVPKYL